MIKNLALRVFMLVCLILIGGNGLTEARTFNKKVVLSTSTEGNNGQAWRQSIANFNFANCAFHAVINVDNATDGANLISLGNSQIGTGTSNYNTIEKGFHVYYAKSKENWRSSASPKPTLTNVLWIDIISSSSQSYGLAVYKENVTGDVTIDVDKNGVSVNGEVLLAASRNFEGYTISDFFNSGSKTLYYSSAEGSTRSTATYKEISWTYPETTSTTIEDEANKTQCDLLPTDSKAVKSTTLNLDNAFLRVKMNIANCVAKTSGNYNLLSISKTACTGTWTSIANGVHVYYQRQSRTQGSNTFSNGVLWFDVIYNNGISTGGFVAYVAAPADEVTIELRKDGIYCNGQKKVASTLHSNDSGWNSLFASGNQTIYYSNNEGNNQESKATYEEISVVPFTTVDSYLKEGADNSEQCYDGAADKVKIERTLNNGYWNTFCVPFGVTYEQLQTLFGNNTQVRKMENVSGTTVRFANCNTEGIAAGVPYLVKPENTVANPIFTNVTFAAQEPSTLGEEGGVQMVGTYSTKELATDGTNLFLATDNKFYKPRATGNTMKGMRAYFIVPTGTNASAMRVEIDNVETSLSEVVDAEAATADQRVFNLQGQLMGTSLENLPSGVYIQNGKKVLVR